MKAIGLTGGIGSGKSTIACILKHLGYPVYIADTEASRLMNCHPDIRQELIKRFGPATYTDNQNLNKPFLAKTIFEDTHALADINRIVHPRVMADFKEWCSKQTAALGFFESAILFEAGLNEFFPYIICVTAPAEVRLQRVIARDHTTADKVKERIRNQMDDSDKCRRSDFIIYNDDEHMVMPQVIEILERLKAES